jgi:DNA-directed RNA polymerase specialized sigma24 family protein
MSLDQSISIWLSGLKRGDQRAAQEIWERYITELMKLVRKKLRGVSMKAVDEEDVALSAMQSFFRGAAAGRFPKLDDRTDLWKLLVVIGKRKAFARLRKHFSPTGGSAQVRGGSIFHGGPSSGSSREYGIERFEHEAPTPDEAAGVVEACERLLAMLDSERLRPYAEMKLEGYSNREIADRFGCVERTVERKLNEIRKIWSAEVEPPSSA